MGEDKEDKIKTGEHKNSSGKLEMFLVWVKNWQKTFTL